MTSTESPAPPAARGRKPAADKRRAALIATGITVPLLVVAVLLLGSITNGSGGGSTSGPLPALSASVPPHVAAEAAPCTALIEDLPLTLGSLDPRVVRTTPATPYVVAWGDPAVVARCGVAKPATLTPGTDAQLYSANGTTGAFYDVEKSGDGNVFTSVDRQAFVSFTIPGKYQGGTYLPTLNAALLKAMPKAVCSTDPNVADPDTLCSRRSG